MDIKHGVITIDSIIDSLKKNTRCHFYKRENFAEYLGVEARLFPMFALFLGNDYSKRSYLNKVEEKLGITNVKSFNTKLEQVSEFLKDKNSTENALKNICGGDGKMEKQFRNELLEFDLEPLSEETQMYLQALTHPKTLEMIEYSTTEQYVTDLVIHSWITALTIDIMKDRIHFVSVQCENISKKSSSFYSNDIRKLCYEVLLSHTSDHSFVEHVRCDTEFREKKLELTITPLLLRDLLKKTIEQRKEFIMDFLKLPPVTNENLDESTYCNLFLLAIRYFSQGYPIKLEEIQALLITYIVCRTSNGRYSSPMFDKPQGNDSHLYCCFQSVLYYLSILNTLLGQVFYFPPVRYLMSGSRFQKILQQLKKGQLNKRD